MRYILYIITLFACLETQLFGMYTTFFKPTYWTEKPRFDRMNMTSYELTYFHGWASKSFNAQGKKVSLLSFANPEPLLPSFLDPIAKCDSKVPSNNTPIAYALLDGKYSIDVMSNEIVQNFHKHFFVQINVPTGSEYLNDISITPTDKCGTKIQPTKEINDYIEKLSLKLFDTPGKNQQARSFVGPSFLLFGFAKTFNNFKHLDLIDFEFKTGLVLPVIILDHPDIFLYPRGELKNFGVPFQLKFMLGAYDWLNFGVASTLVCHIRTDQHFDNNKSPYPNKVIIPTSDLTSMWHHPLVTFTTYIEGENFLPHWTWYIGFNVVKQYKTVWDICGGTPRENYIVNRYPAEIPWLQGDIRLSSEIDFRTEERKFMPRCKIIYVKRIFGKNCFDTALIAGQVGFEILYDF